MESIRNSCDVFLNKRKKKKGWYFFVEKKEEKKGWWRLFLKKGRKKDGGGYFSFKDFYLQGLVVNKEEDQEVKKVGFWEEKRSRERSNSVEGSQANEVTHIYFLV